MLFDLNNNCTQSKNISLPSRENLELMWRSRANTWERQNLGKNEVASGALLMQVFDNAYPEQ